MLACRTCGAGVDATLTSCLACGSEVALGQFGALLGLVCVRCEAYNDAGSKRCVACDAPLGRAAHLDPAAELEALHAEPLPLEIPVPIDDVPLDDLAFTPAPAAGEASAPLDPSALSPPDAEPAAPRVAAAAPALAPAATAGTTQLSVRLHVERGVSQVGTVFQLTGQSTRIGGAEGEVRFAEDPSLAPVHATLAVRDGGLVLRDEGSDTGLYVRLRGLTIPLRPNTLFAVGDRLLCFRGPVPPTPPRSGQTQRLGSPRPSGTAVLVEERLEGGVAGRAYVRAGPSVTLGRAGCSINLGDDPFVSQTHAELVIEADGGARLRDLGSSNGTFARLPPGAERELQDGDRLRLGREVLRVEIG